MIRFMRDISDLSNEEQEDFDNVEVRLAGENGVFDLYKLLDAFVKFTCALTFPKKVIYIVMKQYVRDMEEIMDFENKKD